MSAPSVAGLLGRIALHFKLVTHEQLEHAVREQGRRGNTKRLGEILLERGHVSKEQLDWLLKAQAQVVAKERDRREAARAEARQIHSVTTRGGESILPPPPDEPPEHIAVSWPAGVSTPPAEVAARLRPDPFSRPPAAAEPRRSPLARPAPEERRAEPGRRPTPAPAPEPAAKPGRRQSSQPPAAPRRSSVPIDTRMLDRILVQAVRLRASDVHIHSGSPVQMRVHGKLLASTAPPLDAAEAERAIFEVLGPERHARFEAEREIDFAMSLPGLGRFRGNAYRQQRGVDAVFRPISAEPPTLEGLGLPSTLARLTSYHQGLVIVTGPAGCGKSSTLAALVNIINEDRRDHIITVEDPIEYLHPSKRCVVNQRQVARHTESFASALRAALREDPDVIAIGELRDLETVSLAITAAETGHLVLATLHTNNAVRTVNRILDVFPPNQQGQVRAMVSESLRAVVSQRLVPTADGSARVPALEVLMVNNAVSNLIREEKTFQIRSVLQTGRALGMCLLDDSLAELVRGGVVTKEAARMQCEDPRLFT